MSLKTTIWDPKMAARYSLPIFIPQLPIQYGVASPPIAAVCLDIDLHSKLSLEHWLPVDSPASNDSFHGVNRSIDEVRLAGSRRMGSGRDFANILKDIEQMVAQITLEGGMPTHAFISDDIMQYLLQNGSIIASNFTIHTQSGTLDSGVHFGLQGTVYIVQIDSWELIQPFHCLICHKPQYNGVINYTGVAVNPRYLTPMPLVGGLSLQPIGAPRPAPQHPTGPLPGQAFTNEIAGLKTWLPGLEEPPKGPVCVCGAAKAGGLHSTWCDIKD